MNLHRLPALAALLLALGSTRAAEPPGTRPGGAHDLEKDAPGVAQTFSRAATAALAAGQLDEAERDFKKVLLLVPDNIPTTLNLSLIAYRRRDYPAAEALLRKACRLAPENGLPWLMLGILHFERDQLDAALAALAQAVLYAPKDPRAHHFLGMTVGRKGWYSGAEDELRKALALDPAFGEAHFNLAVFYLERKPPAVELARRHYENSVDLGGARDSDFEARLAAPAIPPK